MTIPQKLYVKLKSTVRQNYSYQEQLEKRLTMARLMVESSRNETFIDILWLASSTWPTGSPVSKGFKGQPFKLVSQCWQRRSLRLISSLVELMREKKKEIG